MAPGLQPALEFRMVDEERFAPVRIDNQCRAGEVPRQARTVKCVGVVRAELEHALLELSLLVANDRCVADGTHGTGKLRPVGRRPVGNRHVRNSHIRGCHG